MEGNPCIHIRGQLGSLGNSIIQRLLRSKVDIVIQQRKYESIISNFSTELEFSESNIHSSEQYELIPGHRMLLLGFADYRDDFDDANTGIGMGGVEVILVTPNLDELEIDTSEIDSHVVIHDMIPSASTPPWDCSQLDTFMSALVSDNVIEDSESSGWWIAELDVSDAISRLVISDHPMPVKIDISGRRSWNSKQIFEELEMLYKRTIAGQSGEFLASHLTSTSTPGIAVILAKDVKQLNRPDLKLLHDALIKSDGEGWRPTTPIRTGLMHFLIGKMN
jgi:hypothetical protein